MNRLQQLYKNPFELANYIFRIENDLLIGCINLDTYLRFIPFYIVLVDTSSLLYLANTDKYRALFNNITNQIIKL